ncbi:hypothetical protein PPROV_000038300 [Pycnococcus provasolii]|uniref:Phosphatidate cytidylyltransferase n=1 Tax=Pycnococcus provasolii TaxID=41880 RepID=A0A830H8X7_9CHLO|nr:hypothetical protein PPROV_000038300 [Pycnococcus provasolii]
MQPSPEPPADAAVEEGEKKQKKKGELARRIVFGLAVGIVGGFGAFRGGLVFCATVSLISLQCAREYHQIVIQKGRGRGFKGYPPFLQKTLLVTCLFCVVGTHIGIKSGIFEVGVFWLLSQLLIVRASRKVKLGQPKRNLARLSQIASLVFGLVYCGYLPSFWARLRNISIPLSNDVPSWLASTGIVVDGGWTTGLVATVMSLLCVVSADVGAYTFGRLFGSTPLSPVSPKKTVEGAYGGMISAVLCAVGVRAALGAPVHLWASICVGLICFVGGIIGDLIESTLKREVNIKDSGDVLPGHGGLLDRFDSYIFTGALCYFFWYWYTWLSKGAFTLSALLPPGTAVLFPYVT